MILSASAIEGAVLAGDIVIDPFTREHLGPNSYDFCLGARGKTYRSDILDCRKSNEVDEFELPATGMPLNPGRLYLFNTMETMGSSKYVPIIRGRSSTGRLGLFINVTADLIDVGSINQWTLQLAPILPIYVFPGMKIGQVTFWTIQGDIKPYDGKYLGKTSPVESLSYLDNADDRE